MRGANLTGTIVVVGVLLLLAAWLGYLVLEIPPEVDKGLGITLIVFGVFNLLLHRRHARVFLKFKGRAGIGSLGLSALQFLFLGIGVILAVAGIVFLAR